MQEEHNNESKVLRLIKERGIIRIKDLGEQGIHTEHLYRLVKKGRLIRAGRGLYIAAETEITPHYSLALAAKWVPGGVVCLLSALQYHDIGTQLPFEVWMALDRRTAKPRIAYPPLRIVRFSGKALTEGVGTHEIEGVKVKVYSPAKTVADCFKFRNKIGLDVALEALRETLRSRKATVDELWEAAMVCRIAKVMQPYLEAIV